MTKKDVLGRESVNKSGKWCLTLRIKKKIPIQKSNLLVRNNPNLSGSFIRWRDFR